MAVLIVQFYSVRMPHAFGI